MRLPPEAALRADLVGLLEEAGEAPSNVTLDFLLVHIRLLALWNRRYKLTGITNWEGILDRHLRESLIPLRWIGPRGRLLDIGSGNGFPALPILACRPEVEGVLLERSERKCHFLEEVLREARRAGSGVRKEDWVARRGDGSGGTFDYAISRATLSPPHYLDLAMTSVRPGARIFLYAGSTAERLCRERAASGLRLVAQSPIPGRRDSFLFVLEI